MGNLLNQEQLEKFRVVLKSYQPNKSVLREFENSNFAVIAGPAGAGKDTLRSALLKQEPSIYSGVLSTTTRPARKAEQEGIDYYFRSVREVEIGLNNREYFQAQLVHSQQISCMHVDEILRLGSERIGLSILIVQTEQLLRNIKRDIKTIFLIPPSLEILQERMQAERVLDADEVDRRLQAAKQELEIALGQTDYYCLVSGELDELTRHANNFLKNGIRDNLADAQAREIMKNTLEQLQ